MNLLQLLFIDISLAVFGSQFFYLNHIGRVTFNAFFTFHVLIIWFLLTEMSSQLPCPLRIRKRRRKDRTLFKGCCCPPFLMIFYEDNSRQLLHQWTSKLKPKLCNLWFACSYANVLNSVSNKVQCECNLCCKSTFFRLRTDFRVTFQSSDHKLMMKIKKMKIISVLLLPAH